MLTIKVDYRTELVRIALSGRIDGGQSCDAVKKSVQAILDEGHPHLEFDLADVPWISSRGLGCLVLIYEFLRNHGGSMTLRAPNSRVLRVLEATGLSPAVFEVVQARREAVKVVV